VVYPSANKKDFSRGCFPSLSSNSSCKQTKIGEGKKRKASERAPPNPAEEKTLLSSLTTPNSIGSRYVRQMKGFLRPSAEQRFKKMKSVLTNEECLAALNNKTT